MATSSFKSTTSRRGTTTRTESNLSHKSNPKSSDEKNTKKAPLRRSQSVSAVSRTKSDLSSEFLNKIDNPLFSIGHDKEEEEEPRLKSVVSSSSSQRGRSVTRRNADLVTKKETVRSSSNVYNGRRHRSVSRSRSVASDESSVELPIWEDAMSVASLSETEVKTIKAVWEQTKSLTADDSRDYMPNDGIYMANPVPVDDDDLVLLDRRDYARKLNECHERARRLRADLAAEENHEHELSRILKEEFSEPMTTNNVKSSPAQRKKSSERRKMSRRLAEEAMTYFDECVSISTFDSSDFSATEDAATTSVSASNCPASLFSHRQESAMFDRAIHNPLESNLVASSSAKTCLDQSGYKISELGMKFQFSSDQKNLAGNYSDSLNIMSDLKDTGEYFVGDDMEKRRSSCFNIDDYKLCSLAEELLYERVLHRNRIESGNLHLCGGGGMATLHSFSSLI